MKSVLICAARNSAANSADVVFVYAKIVDDKGTVVPDINIPVEFKVKGPAELVGGNPVNSEAGIAAILLKAGLQAGNIEITCSAKYENQVLIGKGLVRSY